MSVKPLKMTMNPSTKLNELENARTFEKCAIIQWVRQNGSWQRDYGWVFDECPVHVGELAQICDWRVPINSANKFLIVPVLNYCWLVPESNNNPACPIPTRLSFLTMFPCAHLLSIGALNCSLALNDHRIFWMIKIRLDFELNSTSF